MYPHQLQGCASNVELVNVIVVAILLQAFSNNNSYPQVSPWKTCPPPPIALLSAQSEPITNIWKKIMQIVLTSLYCSPASEWVGVAVGLSSMPAQVITLIVVTVVFLLYLRLMRPNGDRTELILAMTATLMTLGTFVCGLILLTQPNASADFRCAPV